MDEREAEVVRDMFRMYAYENKSSGEIAKILTDRKVGTNIDHQIEDGLKPRPRLHANLFRQNTIMRMLQNQAYVGIYTSNKTKTIKSEAGKSIRVPKDESEWITFPCERIVDDETFARAQEIMKL